MDRVRDVFARNKGRIDLGLLAGRYLDGVTRHTMTIGIALRRQA